MCKIYADHSCCECLSMLMVVCWHDYFFSTNNSAVELLNPVKSLTLTLPLLANSREAIGEFPFELHCMGNP